MRNKIDLQKQFNGMFPFSSAVAGFASGVVLGAGIGTLLGRKGSSRSAWLKNRSYADLKDGEHRVVDVMTRNLTVCLPDTDLSEVAHRMVEHDCGALPVVDSEWECRPLGIITDRDIVARAVAPGRSISYLHAKDCMTPETITCPEDATLEECCQLMEDNQVRRILVVNSAGKCVGIVSQADIAMHASPKYTTEVLREVSKPGHKAGVASAA